MSGKRHYRLRCGLCDTTFVDDGLMLSCPSTHEPALLRSQYDERQFVPDPTADGVYRYHAWLPVIRRLAGSDRPYAYQSVRLSRFLGLPKLWIAFSGYWPARKVMFETATFKELEAYAVMSRVPQTVEDVMVVSSAGNTAAAFAKVCSQNEIPCLLIIPASARTKLSFAEYCHPAVRIVALDGGADYTDAIRLSERIVQRDGFFPEGGVRNIGRRDALATTLLSATEAIGHLPDFYFQAIGSGSGAIAVHEAAKRLHADGRWGSHFPRLMVSQNLPFAPIADAWKLRKRKFIPVETALGRRLAHETVAPVLTNRKPPYSLEGGLFDVLSESDGEVFGVASEDALKAVQMFEELEGVDIDPAAGVALASLIEAKRTGQVTPDSTILLNVTGGGFALRQSEQDDLTLTSVSLTLSAQVASSDAGVEEVLRLFA